MSKTENWVSVRDNRTEVAMDNDNPVTGNDMQTNHKLGCMDWSRGAYLVVDYLACNRFTIVFAIFTRSHDVPSTINASSGSRHRSQLLQLFVENDRFAKRQLLLPGLSDHCVRVVSVARLARPLIAIPITISALKIVHHDDGQRRRLAIQQSRRLRMIRSGHRASIISRVCFCGRFAIESLDRSGSFVDAGSQLLFMRRYNAIARGAAPLQRRQQRHHMADVVLHVIYGQVKGSAPR